jgi:hypothetical protein
VTEREDFTRAAREAFRPDRVLWDGFGGMTMQFNRGGRPASMEISMTSLSSGKKVVAYRLYSGDTFERMGIEETQGDIGILLKKMAMEMKMDGSL